MNKQVVILKNVTKTYPPDVRAVNGITLSIPRGGMHAFVGPSGSGKSTLLYLVGAMETPTNGSVMLDNVRLEKLPESELTRIRREKVGFIFQDFNLLQNLTALENIMLPMEFRGAPRAERAQQARELLDLVGLAHRASHKPSQLSGGEQQRVAIARALANNPRVILADEPTGNLDSKTAERIYNLFRKLARERTIIVVTHAERLAHLADSVYHLQDGKLAKMEVNKHGNR